MGIIAKVDVTGRIRTLLVGTLSVDSPFDKNKNKRSTTRKGDDHILEMFSQNEYNRINHYYLPKN